MSSRIGKGPWARAFGAVLVPDDSTPEAIRGEELWRQGEVEELRIETGQITARVEECGVTITTPTIRPRVWDAIVSYSRNRGPLELAVRGEIQSVQLDHLLAQDWEEPLIPEGVAVSCRCDGPRSCPHVVATTYAVAAAVDAEPGVLLRWRAALGARGSERRQAAENEDSWRGAGVPTSPPELRGRAESVLKRLGASGVRAGGEDLADVLSKAYEALAEPPK
jgi:uncharacterized Zn finger protein